MTNKRLCNELNPFDSEHEGRGQAHAFQLRGKYIFQSVPRPRSCGRGPASFRWLIGALSALAFFGFIGFQIWHVVAPPQLVIDSPTDANAVTADPQVMVAGHTAPEVSVEINGQEVFSHADGTFAQPVELQYGANNISIRATKKHGLFTIVSRTIMLKAPNAAASPLSLSPSATSEHPLN
ncbi:MAG: hypothetical protein NT003_01650 [Candidatus Magasanikbacteria bacterium]|nr:hypothetical protein [Candidatus Magasanikbacteria bacterium]